MPLFTYHASGAPSERLREKQQSDSSKDVQRNVLHPTERMVRNVLHPTERMVSFKLCMSVTDKSRVMRKRGNAEEYKACGNVGLG